MGIPIAHIEAGLRTNNIMNPYPEEINRKFIDMVSRYLFAPTKTAYNNLVNEGHCSEKIIVTGNTAIDTLKNIVNPAFSCPLVESLIGKRMVLCTIHRRELSKDNLVKMLKTIRKLAIENSNDTVFIFPVHPEPNRAHVIYNSLQNITNIILTDALSPDIFQNLLNLSYMIITDSGGIQEEASFLGKPLLLIRDNTERQESLCQNMRLVGTDGNNLYKEVNSLLNDSEKYKSLYVKSNVYGTGNASEVILEFLKDKLNTLR